MQKIGIIAAYKKESIDQINRVSFEYVAAVEKAGAVPYIIPCNVENISAYIEQMDGFVFPGGADIDPSMYGQTNMGSIETVPQMDTFFLHFFDAVVKSGKKILGICKGMQLCNVYFGGTLTQDIANAKQHNQYEKQYDIVDTAQVEGENSFLYEAFGTKQIPINSLHHQAVQQLGAGLQIDAKSHYDGTIEALSHTSYPIYCVQWHPECLTQNAQLFTWFIQKS